MIYTNGLDNSVNHIIVYDGNTQVSVVRLPFFYSNYGENEFIDTYTMEGWIKRVEAILHLYSKKFSIPFTNLSAKPVKILNEWELL